MKSELCDSYTCIRWQLSDQFILVSVKQHAIISVIGISVHLYLIVIKDGRSEYITI